LGRRDDAHTYTDVHADLYADTDTDARPYRDHLAEVLARVRKSDPGAMVHTLSSELGQRHHVIFVPQTRLTRIVGEGNAVVGVETIEIDWKEPGLLVPSGVRPSGTPARAKRSQASSSLALVST